MVTGNTHEGESIIQRQRGLRGAIKLKIEKNSASCSIFSTLKCEIKVRGKYSVNRVFNGLAHHHISHSPLLFNPSENGIGGVLR